MMLFGSVLAFADHASNAIMCRIDGVFRIVCLHHVEQIGDDMFMRSTSNLSSFNGSSMDLSRLWRNSIRSALV